MGIESIISNVEKLLNLVGNLHNRLLELEVAVETLTNIVTTLESRRWNPENFR